LNLPSSSLGLKSWLPARWPVVVLGWLGLGLLVVGCTTTESNYKVLSKFFDGVPKPGEVRTNRVVLDEDGRPLVLPLKPATNGLLSAKVTFFPHPPYEERKCMECHVSQFSVQLKSPQPKVCFECHDDFLKPAKVQHQAAVSSCTACHNAHGSDTKFFLRPVGAFSTSDLTDAPALALKLKAAADPVSAFIKGRLPDAALGALAGARGAVTNSDALQRQLVLALNQFASGQSIYQTQRFAGVTLRPETQQLLRQKPEGADLVRLNRELIEAAYPAEIAPRGGAPAAQSFCFQCHGDFLLRAKFKHQPVESAACNECHQPHASNFKGLLKKSQKDTCLGCHEAIGAKRKVPHPPVADGDCTACHNPHASDFKHLVKLPGAGVCWDCHDDFLKTAKVKHQPVGDGNCQACHQLHGSENKGLLLQPGGKLCLECHDDFKPGAKSVHQPVGDGDCAACHKPHTSDHKFLLLKPGGKMCAECHEPAELTKGAKVIHQPFADGDCAACHNPHASAQKKLIKKPGAGTCFECHDDFFKDAQSKHQPAAEGDCLACHQPHGAAEKGLLSKAGNLLCAECHEAADLAKVEAHKKDPNAACVKCHDPHASKDKMLLKPGAK